MQYPKIVELKPSFQMNLNDEAEYEEMKKRFNVTNLVDLKKMLTALLTKHLMTDAMEGKLSYVFSNEERKTIPLENLVKVKEMLEEGEKIVEEQIQDVNPKQDIKQMLRMKRNPSKLPWE